MIRPLLLSLILAFSAVVSSVAEEVKSPTSESESPKTAKTTVWLIGDSTVRNNTKGQRGWGDYLAPFFDESKVVVKNKALGGRSSRTFRTEGLWAAVEKELKPGDVVIMQFGHNDNGPMDKGKARASIKGNGDESKNVVVEATKKEETVYSYGWYLRQYAAEAKAKGAQPIILSLVPRNIWKEGKVGRSTNDFTAWAKAAAEQAQVPFIDLNALVADRYETIGQDTVGKEFFTSADHTHTSEAGAKQNAACVATGLKNVEAVKALMRP